MSTESHPRPVTTNVEALLPLFDEALSALQDLSSAVLAELKPPSGPYALFHHLGHCRERVKNVKLILRRIGESRYLVRGLHREEDALRLQQAQDPSSNPDMNRLYVQRDALTSAMRVDYESLYIFANLTLDQWAHAAYYLVGGREELAHPFRRLVGELRSRACRESLLPLRTGHLRDAIWLFYQIRFYRNVFIEHVSRPWQRGISMSVEGEDLNFFSPTPPGWLSSKVVTDALAGLERFAPTWLVNTPDDWWERSPQRILELAFQRIDELASQADQDRVWKAWSTVGGSTVSFHLIAERFIRFIVGATGVIRHVALGNPKAINLGEPAGLEELEAELAQAREARQPGRTRNDR